MGNTQATMPKGSTAARHQVLTTQAVTTQVEDSEWVQDFDENRNRRYWYNPRTSETSFQLPPSRRNHGGGRHTPGKMKPNNTEKNNPRKRRRGLPVPSKSQLSTLPRGWKVATDTSCGKKFYYHPKAQQAVWSFPNVQIEIEAEPMQDASAAVQVSAEITMTCTPLDSLDSLKQRFFDEYNKQESTGSTSAFMMPLLQNAACDSYELVRVSPDQRRIVAATKSQREDPDYLWGLLISDFSFSLRLVKCARSSKKELLSNEHGESPVDRDFFFTSQPSSNVLASVRDEISRAGDKGEDDPTLNMSEEQVKQIESPPVVLADWSLVAGGSSSSPSSQEYAPSDSEEQPNNAKPQQAAPPVPVARAHGHSSIPRVTRTTRSHAQQRGPQARPVPRPPPPPRRRPSASA